MAGERELFLSEIVANPHDDGPRMIYADWLVEQEDPLGDFIHVQCQLASANDWDPGQNELKRREHEILSRNWVQWSAGMRRCCSDIRFRRGFIDEVEIAADHLAAVGLELFEHAPLLNALDVREATDAISKLVACEALDRVESLSLRGNNLTSEHLDRLTFSPYTGRLRALDLSVNQITGTGVNHLTPLRQLRFLKLEHNLLTPRAAEAFVRSDGFANLASLSLRGNRIGWAGVKNLGASPNLQSLRRLDLGENALGSNAVAELVGSHGLKSLKHLELRQNQLRHDGAGLLASSPWLRRVVTLKLGVNGIGDAGATALAQSPHTERVKQLELAGNQIGDVGCGRLAKSRHLPALVSLDLNDNQIGDASVKTILRSEGFSRLQSLDLRNNPISESAQKALKDHFGRRVRCLWREPSR